MLKGKQEKGITLIALVITIIVLLILAGITLNLALAPDGIIKRAQTVGNEYKKEQDKELSALEELENMLNGISEPVTVGDEAITIPEGLSIGDTVKYDPKENTYTWELEYCSSGDEKEASVNITKPASDVILSNTSEDYKITEWKIFDIDKKTGIITLISANPTKGTVYLGGAQGYNNAVKLLNDACNALYGNDTKGIAGRSINIEDIENNMTVKALEEAHSFVHPSDESNTKYGEQVQDKFTTFKNYPSIYASEINSAIDENFNSTGIGRSEQSYLIQRNGNGAINGLLQATTSIQPYQTYWQRNNETMQTSFKGGETNYNLIISQGSNTNYYIASRTINTRALSGECDFNIFSIKKGGIEGLPFIYRITGTNCSLGTECNIRPIITLNVDLIEENAKDGWYIK